MEQALAAAQEVADGEADADDFIAALEQLDLEEGLEEAPPTPPANTYTYTPSTRTDPPCGYYHDVMHRTLPQVAKPTWADAVAHQERGEAKRAADAARQETPVENQCSSETKTSQDVPTEPAAATCYSEWQTFHDVTGPRCSGPAHASDVDEENEPTPPTAPALPVEEPDAADICTAEVESTATGVRPMNESRVKACEMRGYFQHSPDVVFEERSVFVYMQGEHVNHKDMSACIRDGAWRVFSFLPGFRLKTHTLTNDDVVPTGTPGTAPEKMRGIVNLHQRECTTARWFNRTQTSPYRVKFTRSLDAAVGKKLLLQHNFDQARSCTIYAALYTAFLNDPQLQTRGVLDNGDIMLPSLVPGIYKALSVHPDAELWQAQPEIVCNTIIHYAQHRLLMEMKARLSRPDKAVRSCLQR
jgi:hypothetical protein